jgi:hypothetical protein
MAEAPEHRSTASVGMFAVRYGLGIVMVIAGIVVLIAVPGTGVDGFAMAAGGGLSVILINGLFRLGVAGDKEREQEEAARRYFDEHGEWPDDPAPKRRKWTLPAGVVPPEDDD